MATPSKPRAKKAAPKTQAAGVLKIQELEDKAFTAGMKVGRGDLFTALAKIEARLEFLNERDNMASFALAVPGMVDKPDPRRMDPEPAEGERPIRGRGDLPKAFASGPTTAPVSQSVLSRLFDLEERVAGLARNQAEESVATNERLARIESVLGMS